jgi:hypothetical protein
MSKFDVSSVAGIVLAAIVFSVAQSRPASSPSTGPEATAIGTFKSQEVVVAYYKSPAFKAKMKSLHEQHAEAKRKGDAEKVRELEKTGEALQERAHQQYDGEAPIDEVIEELRPSLPEIAKAAGVGAIVADFVWKDPAFKTVDLTERLVQRLAPPGK